MNTQTQKLPKVQRRQINYTGHARAYDQRRFAGEQLSYYEWLRDRALARAMSGVQKGASILDVGCGTGRGLVSLTKLGFTNLTGMDFTADMLRQASAKLSEGESAPPRLVRGDAFRLPFRDGQFDVVASFNFLHMFEYPLQAELVSEMHRVARHVLVVELESIHKGLIVTRYPEQWRSRDNTKFNSYAEVSRLFGRDRFTSWCAVGSVLPLVHRWLSHAPRLGAAIDAICALPLAGWLASRVFVVGSVRQAGGVAHGERCA